MRFAVLSLLLAGLASAFAIDAYARLNANAGSKLPLAHMVFFTLKDHSKESREKFVAGCEKYLKEIPGSIHFSLGEQAQDVEEPVVSVRDFDVALHVIFENKEARDVYLVHPQHKAFVAEFRPIFEKVRVFDSYIVKK
ncbi:MAG: hypothetical protein ABS79_02230 [Planctomycetes bacterium SCN 63-9]|nr:MAG: hypothetical protein ABS79_02230 [Planctomycetes bacterium SCN 63-9]